MYKKKKKNWRYFGKRIAIWFVGPADGVRTTEYVIGENIQYGKIVFGMGISMGIVDKKYENIMTSTRSVYTGEGG